MKSSSKMGGIVGCAGTDGRRGLDEVGVTCDGVSGNGVDNG